MTTNDNTKDSKQEKIFILYDGRAKDPDDDKALLIVNPEQSETSYLYEFSEDETTKEIIVRKSESELNWNQY